MSDCNQMNCRNMCGSYTRPAAMMRGGAPDSMYRRAQKSQSSCGGCAQTHHTECGCRKDPLDGMALGIGYVPWQKWKEIYETDKAIYRGTIFAALDKPFCGVRGGRRA